MNEKERMIEMTKKAYKSYKVLVKKVNEPSSFAFFNFAYTKYFFYMQMLTTIYQDLNDEVLETEWIKEIEND